MPESSQIHFPKIAGKTFIYLKFDDSGADKYPRLKKGEPITDPGI